MVYEVKVFVHKINKKTRKSLKLLWKEADLGNKMWVVIKAVLPPTHRETSLRVDLNGAFPSTHRKITSRVDLKTKILSNLGKNPNTVCYKNKQIPLEGFKWSPCRGLNAFNVPFPCLKVLKLIQFLLAFFLKMAVEKVIHLNGRFLHLP